MVIVLITLYRYTIMPILRAKLLLFFDIRKCAHVFSAKKLTFCSKNLAV